MKKNILTLVLALFATTLLQAAQVNESAARNIAAQFMQARGMGAIAPSLPMKAPQQGGEQAQTNNAAYYVFNAQSGHGFVIVSGDDRTQQPVLGYSNKSSFDPDNVPENMRWWLMQYATEIAMLNAGVIQADVEPAMGNIPMKASAAIQPLIKSQWRQGKPFNLQCPKIGDKYCMTGCTATAMAQIMYYHKWPTSTSTTIPSYTVDGTTYPALAATTFQYSKMKDQYNDTSSTDEANAAVAKLMRYCGQAVQMKYGTKSSGALAECEAMVDFFKFSTKARKLYRFDYSAAQWQNYILNELQALRPVIYSARTHSGGHDFICDGYDGNGYFHFNWGWGGISDGYFLLSALNPSNQGIGSSQSENGYTIQHYILIGLEPNTTSTTEKNSNTGCAYVTPERTSYTRNSSAEPFVINVIEEARNNATRPRTYDIGWGVYKDDGFTQYQVYNSQPNIYLASDSTHKFTRTLNFGKNFADGTYYLRPICRETGNSSWYPCYYSGVRYIKAVINGNNLTLTEYNDATPTGITARFYSYSGVRKVGRPVNVKVEVTNNSMTEFLTFYLRIDDELVGANSIELSKGSTGYLNIVYTPKKSGANALTLTREYTVLCTSSINVEDATPASLTITSSMTTTTANNQIVGNSLTFKATTTNNLSTTFKDYIYCRLYKVNTPNTNIVIEDEQRLLNLAGGASATSNISFNDLSPGKYYAVYYYYNYSELNKALTTNIYQVGDRGNLTVTYNLAETHANNQVAGNKLTFNTSIKNKLTTSYHNYIIVKLFKKTLLGNVSMGEIKRMIEIDGSTAQLSSSINETFSFADLTAGNYFVKFYYYDYNEEKMALQTATYEVLGTIKGDVNGDGKVNVSDVTALINMILGITTTDQARADVNGDGKVNVSDVTALINLILGIS